MGLRRRKPNSTATEEEISVQGCVEPSEDSSMESGPKRDSQGSATDCSQNPDTDEERLSVRSRVQKWARNIGSSLLRKTKSRSQGPSPHSPQNPGNEDERPSVQARVQQWEGHIMRSAAEKDPASRSQGSSTDSLNSPTSEGETLSVQRHEQMWGQGTSRQALAEGDPALSTQSPAQELRDTDKAWRQTVLEEREKKEMESTETIGKMQGAIEELQSDLQSQRQANTDLQQELISAHAAFAEQRDADKAWRQTLQEEREKKEEELKDTITKMQGAIKELQSDLQSQRQANTDLQQELIMAYTAFVEQRAVDEAWRQTLLTDTIAKMQGAIEGLQGDLQFQREANTDLANRQKQQESELEMFREEKRRKEERKRRSWWRFWKRN